MTTKIGRHRVMHTALHGPAINPPRELQAGTASDTKGLRGDLTADVPRGGHYPYSLVHISGDAQPSEVIKATVPN